MLRDYSEALGIAYQIRDDLEDLADTEPADGAGFGGAVAAAGAGLRQGQGVGPRPRDGAVARRPHQSCGPHAAFRALLGELGVEDRARALLEAYKEQAIRTLPALQNASLKGLLRRVVGKVFRVEIKGWCSEFETRDAAGRQAGAQAAG